MRVISGNSKGIPLLSPKNHLIRPTSDKIKGAIFNILQSFPEHMGFLDLFSGSGSIAIEAASRGYTPVYLVEKDKDALDLIRDNIIKTKMTSEIIIKKGDIGNVIDDFHKNKIYFDIIFADPPYNLSWPEKIATLLDKFNILSPKGILIIEEKEGTLKDDYGTFKSFKTKIFGKTHVKFYHREELL
jgi:16S rRNA (guanine(966)-N(2))-methyltransferase RsmD